METLKQIEQADAARRTRAWKFQKAQEEAWSANKGLESIEAKLAAPQADVTTLTEILRLAKSMPSGITTRGTQLQPGGANLQLLIRSEIEGALAVMADQRKALEDSLPAARARVVEADARLTAAADPLKFHGTVVVEQQQSIEAVAVVTNP